MRNASVPGLTNTLNFRDVLHIGDSARPIPGLTSRPAAQARVSQTGLREPKKIKGRAIPRRVQPCHIAPIS